MGPGRFEGLAQVRLRLEGPAGSDGGAQVTALVATSLRSRLLGLAFLDEPQARCLLFPRCSSVHTFGMRFAIDVVFVDLSRVGPGMRDLRATPGSSGRILKVVAGVTPRRFARLGGDAQAAMRRRDVAALEIPAPNPSPPGCRRVRSPNVMR